MPSYTVTLSSVDDQALSYITVSQQEWIDNYAANRIRKAKAEIVSKLITHCNANNIALAVGEDAQVQQAFTLGVVSAAT